ncbi:NAD(P)H-hydrate dehydratase [Acutalibacter caecimuris]|uniref:NAD(P)H-hydrate dehydratase n=1 Tax=Acutalibacter caecimuris TaxID=3093657 RepID=UPI002AC9293D|nr:NAD(P)H-hydrate dehydratase [Acutalibacter sp. M00118]
MKLFTRTEMQRLEAAAESSGVSLAAMMDNAGTALAQEAQARWGPLTERSVVLLCGKGNNGGDGFICAARLAQWGASCTVLLLHGRPQSSLAQGAFSHMPASVQVIDATQAPAHAEDALSSAEVAVDCVFGFGFQGQLDETSAHYLELANALPCRRIAADLPSGVECDTARVSPGAFRAHVTVAFTAEKPAHRSYPAMELCGQTVVRPVGIPQALTRSARTLVSLNSPEIARPLLLSPGALANKGDLGHLLLVCGSYGMAGACIMAAKAALRCGIGLLHIAADSRIYPILAAAVPEAVYTVLDLAAPATAQDKLAATLESCTACVIGCGLGELASHLCPVVFSHPRVPLLIDADGLNFCARQGFVPDTAGLPLVITPHPGEAARLTGRTPGEIQQDRIGTAQRLAEQFGGVALLKGAATVIAAPNGRLAINPTGNPGMAKGGSGDVLAGIIGTFLAQGAGGFPAATAGAYIHGLAGDLCREKLSARAMLPTDLIQYLPEIIKNFESR